MDSYLITLLIVCPLVFIAGFIDSIAGGGGIISLPAYIFAGIPIQIAHGTNKFANCIGTSIAARKFFKTGNVKLKPALFSAGGALIGSAVGAQMVVLLDEKILQYCLMIILPIVALFLMFNKGFGSEEKVRELPDMRLNILSFIIGLAVGWYDGFFGPGTGTFLVIAFSTICGLNIIVSSGNAKIVNLASNFAALIVYLINGKIFFALGIPAAICSILGNYLGSHLAIKKGAKFIKIIILFAVALLFGKILIDFI